MFSGLLSNLLALAAILLGLSLFVQITQEVYKYLTSSKGRLYRKVLGGFLGPWARQVDEAGLLADLRMRSPFQIRDVQPEGKLLPMDEATLVGALERTAHPLVRRALDLLRLDRDTAATAASPPWRAFRTELQELAAGSSPDAELARRLDALLQGWPDDAAADARRLLHTLRSEFLPHVLRVEREFAQLMRNFDYEYRRRNMRQTFLLGFVVAVLFNLPFSAIYTNAVGLSPDEVQTLVEQNQALYDRYAALTDTTEADTAAADTSASSVPAETRAVEDAASEELLALHREVLTKAVARNGDGPRVDYRRLLGLLTQPSALVPYLFWCLVTAFLVSFGAPFWNDLIGALSRLQRGERSYPPPPGET